MTIVIGMCFYAAASLLWSPDWRDGILRLQSIVILTGIFIISLQVPIKRYVPLIAAASLLASGALAVYRPDTHGGLGNENFQAEFLSILIPLALMGLREWYDSLLGTLCALAAVAGIVVVIFWNASSASYALAAGPIALAIYWTWKHQPAICGLIILAVGGSAITWPQTVDAIFYSAILRLEFVINTVEMWLDYPVLGTGLGGYNYLYPKYAESHLQWINMRGVIPGYDGTAVHGLNHFIGAAHNEFAQALAVFGIVGFVPLMWAAWLAFRCRS